jgi:hypothetical protein
MNNYKSLNLNFVPLNNDTNKLFTYLHVNTFEFNT